MTFLQIAWFILIAVLLIGYAILDGFDLGTGFWYAFFRDEKDKRAMLNSIRPFWDGNEVWLLTGGGAIFAAFPPVYASVFSGFYLALMLVLSGLILRAVSIDFRDKIESPSWKKKWDIAITLGSFLPALLFGVAVGNIVKGIPLNYNGDYTGTFFQLLNPYSLLCGVMGFAMFATHGALYLTFKTPQEISERTRGYAKKSWMVFFVTYLLVVIWSFISYTRGPVILTGILTILSIGAMVGTYILSGKREDFKAFLSSGISIALLMAATGSHLFPYLLPSTSYENMGLTIYNSSSSYNTLFAMLIIALIGMPIVIFYTSYLYRVFSGKSNSESLYN